MDFLWPKSNWLIFKKLFLPYVAFITYFLVFLVITKNLQDTRTYDPEYYEFTSEIFLLYNFLFELVLFIGCFYFAKHDV